MVGLTWTVVRADPIAVQARPDLGPAHLHLGGSGPAVVQPTCTSVESDPTSVQSAPTSVQVAQKSTRKLQKPAGNPSEPGQLPYDSERFYPSDFVEVSGTIASSPTRLVLLGDSF